MLADAQINQEMMDLMSEGVYFVDPKRCIRFWNQAAEGLTGYLRDDIVGRHCYDNLLQHVDAAGKRLCYAGCPLQATMKDGQGRETDVFLSHKEGHRVSVHVRTTPVYNASGEIVGGMEVFTENNYQLSNLERIEDLRRAAFLDPLTGLPNRRYGEIYIQSRLNFLGLEALPFALGMIDVDRFKIINDLYGHNAGDHALKVLGQTLANSLRTYDSVIRVHLSISLGAAIARPEDSLQSLLERADRLMYQSKSLGGNCATLDPQDTRFASLAAAG